MWVLEKVTSLQQGQADMQSATVLGLYHSGDLMMLEVALRDRTMSSAFSRHL